MGLRFVEDLPERINIVFTRDRLEALRSRPGEWALIRTYRYRGGGRPAPKHPPDIELRYRYLRNDTLLYARARVHKEQS